MNVYSIVPSHPFPRDGVGRLHEDEGQISPKQSADQQVELGAAQIERPTPHSERAEARCEEPDREHADEAVKQPDDLPDPVTPDDMELPLGKTEQRVELRMLDA